MRRLQILLLGMFVVLFLFMPVSGKAQTKYHLYLDHKQSIEKRIEDLLKRMTLEEKVGQLNMPCVYENGLGTTIQQKTEAVKQFAKGTRINGLGPGGGFFTLPNTILHKGTRQQVEFLNELQRIAITETRLGIPLLLTEEGTHGLMCSGGTIYPEGPALGGTWNLELLSRIYSATAKEARAIGIHQIFTLVVEPIRDPRLGRNQEAYSEDTFLTAKIAETIVKAVQGDDVSAGDKCVAGLCHYPGQSEPVSGLERGAMEISERKLREIYLPSWEAGVKKAGALGVMATYPAIDGIPVHASEWILTEILRNELGFDGLVLGEGGGIGTIIYEGLAEDMKQAGQITLRAGVDVGISYESGYMVDLVESVREGAIKESFLDRAVRRVLKQKFRLGLFEQPYVDLQKALKIVHHSDHQQLALQAAREGIVLLKNENDLLPLDRSKVSKIVVIGPNADDEKNQLGDYVSETVLQEITTVLAGIKKVAPMCQVSYVKGCDIIGTKTNEIDQAKKMALNSDVAIVVLGENAWGANIDGDYSPVTSGEGFDVATLELTGMQGNLVKEIVSTGTPTVVVLINGRALATQWIAAHVPAIIEAWIPGEKGGMAIAEIIFGDVNPSGKLTVTIPRHVGQLPVYYNYPKSKRFWLTEGWGKSYMDIDPSPLYPFGFGLSYTHFEYSNLQMSKNEIITNEGLTISVDVKNVGNRFGKEVVQLYIEDVIASVATPVKELKGFEKVALKSGEKKKVFFELLSKDLALYNRELELVVEPGVFKIMVGFSSVDIQLTGKFNVLIQEEVK
jgi:beta-glucosidase